VRVAAPNPLREQLKDRMSPVRSFKNRLPLTIGLFAWLFCASSAWSQTDLGDLTPGFDIVSSGNTVSDTQDFRFNLVNELNKGMLYVEARPTEQDLSDPARLRLTVTQSGIEVGIARTIQSDYLGDESYIRYIDKGMFSPQGLFLPIGGEYIVSVENLHNAPVEYDLTIDMVGPQIQNVGELPSYGSAEASGQLFRHGLIWLNFTIPGEEDDIRSLSIETWDDGRGDPVDTEIFLLDQNGMLIESDDDDGVGFFSKLEFNNGNAPPPGDYTLLIGGYNTDPQAGRTGTDTGSFRVSFSHQSLPFCDQDVRSREITQTATWHLLSLPCFTPSGTTFGELFSDDALMQDSTKWSAYTYDASAGAYQPLTADVPVPAPGTGFWFNTTEPMDLILPDDSFGRDLLIEDCVHDACVRLRIDGDTSWNMIGNPLDETIRYSDVEVDARGTDCTLLDFTTCSLDDSRLGNASFFYSEYLQAYVEFARTASISPLRRSVGKPWDGFWTRFQNEPGGPNAGFWGFGIKPFFGRYWFVTDNEFTGDLGGLDGADQICQAEADEAGLPGTYKAWLSDSTGSPSTRFNQVEVPYLLPNGLQVAASYAQIIASGPTFPLNISPTLSMRFIDVWTSTRESGLALSDHCETWSSSEIFSVGILGSSSETLSDIWTFSLFADCNTNHALYCVGQ
jgi:hypothetical protein